MGFDTTGSSRYPLGLLKCILCILMLYLYFNAIEKASKRDDLSIYFFNSITEPYFKKPQPVFISMPSDPFRLKFKERIQLPFASVKVPVVLLSTGLNHTLCSEALRFTEAQEQGLLRF